MAHFNTQYYKGNDQYSDGDIEDKILQIVRESESLEESGERSFPVLYHLSHVRENILSWYSFREGASVLEIGPGPGAITGLLCRRCRKVTSVELSHRRAMINYERHKEFDNLTIMVGNLNDMQFSEAFDYVILNGVFEYAGSFTQGNDPYGTFLKRCAGYLKDDGILLIAIENRLGLKYFAGAPEDHTENYMEGLKDYPDNSSVHTFSKHEWENLLDRCGLPFRRFYYPYPDYKFPNEIFTGESLSADGFSRNAWNFNPRRLELFDEQQMGSALCGEGVMECFMNSFLIETGSEEAGRGVSSTRVIYAKLSTDRAPQFRIQTVISEDGKGRRSVVKSPVCPEAEGHLRRMNERELESAGQGAAPGPEASLLQGRLLDDGSVAYPYLEAMSLEKLIEPDEDSIRAACAKLYGLIMSGSLSGEEYTEEFTRLFGSVRPDHPAGRGYEMVHPANIDLIFGNIFPSDGHADIIDGEWITDAPVPALFLLWRAVNELYSSRRSLEMVLPQEELLKEYGIGAGDRQLFWKWAEHFEKKYVKANSLSAYALPARRVSLDDLQWSGEDVRLTASLYTDRGNGFREEDSIHVDLILRDGRYDVSFEIENPDEVRALRFDPLEGCACVCSLKTGEGTLRAVNASARSKRGDVFLTMDPAYRISCRKIPSVIRVTGCVKTKDVRWALDKSQELLHKRMGQADGVVRRAAKRLLAAVPVKR